jgi:hypothetical protein
MSPGRASTQPWKQQHRSDPGPSKIGRSPVAPHGECGPCSQNTDATGNELPFPARHGQNERLIALNRKNALFAGSDGGAEHWAVIASLIETCKLNEVDPLAYMTDVLTRIVNGHPNSEIDRLLPWAYRRQHLKAVA